MRAFVIAGEPSGDRLGAALMAGLKELEPGITFDGIGGTGMAGEGLDSLFPMSDLSVMGIAEIAPKYFHLKRRIRETAERVIATEPDVLITIDSPDFCLRVARLVKAARPAQKVVHYVAPTVWAWRPGRAVKMAEVVDHVLTLLPFEPPYMERAGMTADFVGHPVVAEPVATAEEAAAFRAAHGIGDAPLLLVLPGSRKGEVTRLGRVLGATLAEVLAAQPDLRVVVPVAQGVEDLLGDVVSDWKGDPILVPPEAVADKRAAFAAADAALAASGTVSVELAAAGTPMVIAYDVAWLTRQIAKRMLITDTFTLVNLVADTRVVPEFVGPDCRAALIAPAVLALLRDPHRQDAAMALTMERLGLGGEAPGLRAARSVLAALTR